MTTTSIAQMTTAEASSKAEFLIAELRKSLRRVRSIGGVYDKIQDFAFEVSNANHDYIHEPAWDEVDAQQVVVDLRDEGLIRTFEGVEVTDVDDIEHIINPGGMPIVSISRYRLLVVNEDGHPEAIKYSL